MQGGYQKYGRRVIPLVFLFLIDAPNKQLPMGSVPLREIHKLLEEKAMKRVGKHWGYLHHKPYPGGKIPKPGKGEVLCPALGGE